jgi:hypothetical protein
MKFKLEKIRKLRWQLNSRWSKTDFTSSFFEFFKNLFKFQLVNIVFLCINFFLKKPNGGFIQNGENSVKQM